MNITRLYVFLVAVLMFFVVAYAFHSKGDVRADLKVLGLEFSIDTKDRIAPPKVIEEPSTDDTAKGNDQPVLKK